VRVRRWLLLYMGVAWRRVQGFLGTDKPARAAVGQCRPRRPRSTAHGGAARGS
jgi:hypothetical protein